MGPILLVALDRALADQLSRLLEPAAVSVAICQYGPDTVRAIERQAPPLVVIDLSRLPADGEMLCHQLSRLPFPPTLVAIVRPEVEAAVSALDRGAAVCLNHPPEPRHLVAQIMAVLRLATPQRDEEAALVEVGDLSIDHGRRQATAGGKPLPLTPTEFRILGCLARWPGRVIPPSDVLRECTGLSLSEREAMDLLKVHVYRLRRKLRAAGAPPEALRTARGFGYLLERRVTTEAPPVPHERLRRSA